MTPSAAPFDTAACRAAAEAGHLDDWLHTYLLGGPWANPGLSAGLRRQTRHWIGPALLRLDALERCCGPEPDLEFVVDAEGWRRKIAAIANSLVDPAQLPPLIVQWRKGILSVRDGNHRLTAAGSIGWIACWAVIWYDDPTDADAVQRRIAAAAPLGQEHQ